MKKINRFILLLTMLTVLVILNIALVSAASTFQVKLERINSSVLPGERAEYEMTITNLNNAPDTFTLNFYNSNKWSVETENIAYLSGVNLPGENFVKFKIFVVPSQNANYGPHEFQVNVTSKKGGNTQPVSSIIVVKDPTNTVSGYIPSINLDVDFPEEVDPRNPFDLKINLLNKNRLDIPELIITVESKLFSGETVTSLGPQEKKTEVFAVTYDKLTVPQEDLLIVTVSADKGSFTTKKQVKVKEYSDLHVDEKAKRFFLKDIVSRVYFNEGNVVNTEAVVYGTALFNQIFTKTTPKAEVIKKDGQRMYTWKLSISPEGTQVITVVTNFRPLFFIIILIILGVIGYYVFRSPLVITKEATVLNKEEGGISHIKVLLHLKNRSNKPAENVVIMDRVTHIAEVEREFSHGTLAPEKILKHEKKGTVLKWSITMLEAYEERILTYKLKSRLNVIGSMKMPQATVKFKNAKGNTVKISSNTALTQEK